MIYTVDQITKIADCDAVLEMANMKRRILNIKKEQEELDYDNASVDSVDVEIALDSIVAEISAREIVYAGLPEGPGKVAAGNVLYKLGYKKLVLEERKKKSGIVAVLDREYTRAVIDLEVTENQAYIDAVTARKNEL